MSRKTLGTEQKFSTPWDEAVHDAEDQLFELVKKESAFRDAIAILKESKKRGDPWPGANAA